MSDPKRRGQSSKIICFVKDGATRLKSKEEASKLVRPKATKITYTGWIKYTEINKGMEIGL